MDYIKKLGIRLTSSSFKDCYLDVGNKSTGLSLEKKIDWPEFKSYKGKYPNGDSAYQNNNVIRFVVSFYDPNSPFANLEWKDRRICAAEFAGFPKNKDGSFSESAQKVLNLEIPAVRAMVIRYCRVVRDFEYSTYKVLEHNYLTKVLMSDKISLSEIEKNEKTLKQYRDKFLSGDPNRNIREEFYKVVSSEEQELVKLRPEFQQRYWDKDISSITLNDEKIDDEIEI